MWGYLIEALLEMLPAIGYKNNLNINYSHSSTLEHAFSAAIQHDHVTLQMSSVLSAYLRMVIPSGFLISSSYMSLCHLVISHVKLSDYSVAGEFVHNLIVKPQNPRRRVRKDLF